MADSNHDQEDEINDIHSSLTQSVRHLVIPGEIIATHTGDNSESSFLRGHGTYIETLPLEEGASHQSTDHDRENNDDDEDEPMTEPQQPQRLIASVSGIVERVNKLISVVPAAPMPFVGHVGDLIIGRITAVGPTRWKVDIGPGSRAAQLPLSGVNLPGGVQRVRTAEDALGMRKLFREGDLVSAEIQQVMASDGGLSLHTRSLRYGKLENGCLVVVPPALIRRMKQHFVSLGEGVGVDVLLGKNGFVWLQRTIPSEWQTSMQKSVEEIDAPLAETLQKLRQRHAATEVLPDERETICRVRNSIEALRMVHCGITPQTIMSVYSKSIKSQIELRDMLTSEGIVTITQPTRVQQ
mmetsp:Transcript_56928/g.66541  ORF Transcript_56928/g.66541 Transcript_56928/m.66541 type:complete len:353 (+) Transcript_56928:78-1136(+)